jgi:hypothetical protein
MTRTMTVATRCGGADSDRPSGVTTSLGSWGQRLTVVTGGACREEEESTKEQDYGIMFFIQKKLRLDFFVLKKSTASMSIFGKLTN